jgi:hypothetical protein
MIAGGACRWAMVNVKDWIRDFSGSRAARPFREPIEICRHMPLCSGAVSSGMQVRVVSPPKKQLGSIVILLGVLLLACQLLTPKLSHQCGIEYNAERPALGLPVIPSDWKLEPGERSCVWRSPDWSEKKAKHIPVYASKFVSFQAGVLMAENDTYFGPHDFFDFDGTRLRDRLDVTYNYHPDKDHPQWDVTLTTNQRYSPVSKITLERANQILVEWGIDYAYPIP